jgi:5-methylcytosine-specific restriction endonuclease McrA
LSGQYPPNWDEIAAQVKEEAGWCCEHCGHPDDLESGHVLTVHHLDGNKSNCERTNLVAHCQRCHLHFQARFIPGQIVFDFYRPDWMARRGLGV